MNWKWSNGETYERSKRIYNDATGGMPVIMTGPPCESAQSSDIFIQQYATKVGNSAYATALHHDEHTWDIVNQCATKTWFTAKNRREEMGNKLAARDMVQQIGFNPFFPEGHDRYVEGMTIRDQYLKPMNTTEDYTKPPFEN